MGKLKSDSRQIGDLVVRTTQLDACSSLALFPKLGNIIAPAVAPLATLAAKAAPRDGAEISLADVDLDDLAPALGAMFARMAADDIVPLALQVLASTRATGGDLPGETLLCTREAINLAFDGDFVALLATLKFAIEVNFANFIKLSRRGARRPAAETPAA